MSNGVSNMFESAARRMYDAKMAAFINHSDDTKLEAITAALDRLDCFKLSTPRLTEYEWTCINDAINELRELLK